MRRHILVSLALLTALTGCMPAPTPQENYDAALKNLERVETRLDNLRPAYDAARKLAVLQVCEEIAGSTPEESALGAMSQLESILGGAATDQSATQQPAGDQPTADPAAATKPVGDADAALDQLLNAHKDIQEKTAAMTATLGKTNEVMKQINTPGTPEAKRVEQILAELPEVKAYRRQEQRVARAQQALDEAEALLPAAATK